MQSSTAPRFESAHSHLKAGAAVAVGRDEESSVGDISSMIFGGGVAVRLLDGHKKSVLYTA